MNDETINDTVLEFLDRLDRPTLERVARLFIEECGYLHEHEPADRELFEKYSCSSRNWCTASYGGKCDGGHTVTSEPWCDISGFDCPECELVDELRAIAAEVTVPP